MQTRKGIAVSPGVAIFPALVLDAEDQPVPRRAIPPARVDYEQKRLHEALADSIAELDQLREQTATALGNELANIFSFHLGMLRDQHLINQIEAVIANERVTAEYAVYKVTRRLAETFMQQQKTYLNERVSDVWDLERRILKHLVGYSHSQLHQLTDPAVILAHDLTPSQTASLDKEKIRGLATDAGGRTSHTAILAHALGIPAVVGLGDITQQVTAGQTVIIDGHRGMLVIDPDAETLMQYRHESQRMAAVRDELGEIGQLPAITADGTKVTLHANIEFPSEIALALRNGAVGVGLYRTEFLYLASETEPTEQEQFEVYRQASDNLNGKPLTIRTLDLGADKVNQNLELHGSSASERNPFLGCRSIRLCLQNLPLFKTQLRAILRASAHGSIRVMFPLISNIMELRQARMILNDVMEDLHEQGIDYDRDIPVGMMIEVPSAALQAGAFAREVDFFSIGTNDLIQYTVAVDRANERIASLYSAAHPAVISLVKEVVRAANRAKIEVSLCGEMAGEPEFAMLLLGLGLRSLSISPPAIPEIKKVIRAVSLDHCQSIARKVSAFESEREVLNYLRDEVNKVIPEVYDGRSIAR